MVAPPPRPRSPPLKLELKEEQSGGASIDTGAAQSPEGASSHQQGLNLDSGGAYQDSGGAGDDDASASPSSPVNEVAQASGGAEELLQPPA